ncbi:MAG: sulfatase/phosphatase domain-containing protein, partial [Acidobacteriota bacterium]
HAEFEPAARHKGRYAGERFIEPVSQSIEMMAKFPMWVQNQRNSWHGVEFPYHSDLNIAEYYKRYAETLLAVDDSVGRVMSWLEEKRLLDSTLVIYMGDNGFAFGEHGLIDKRTAYEESMRVPMLMQCPELFKGGTTIEQVVANIDIAPTLLEAAALRPPANLDGRSFLGLGRLTGGSAGPWREELLYEYFWERNFPHTPTIHALRGDRYKYIHYHGVWDSDELFDLREDPRETKNLIDSPEHRQVVKEMNQKLFGLLGSTGGMYIPLYPDRGGQSNLRHRGRSKSAPFPERMLRR